MNFKSIRNEANYFMKQGKRRFYTNLVDKNSHNQKKLYAVAINLLIPKKELCFPDHHDMNSLANELGQYFTTKVETVRSQLNSVDTQHASIPSSTITCQLLDFDPLSEEEINFGLCEKILLARPNAYLSNAEMAGHFVTSDNILDKFVVRNWPISRCVERGYWLPFAKRC